MTMLFLVKGLKAGGGEVEDVSHPFTATISNGNASFHQIAVRFKDPQPRLSFEYEVIYVSDQTDTIPQPAKGTEGRYAPTAGSKYIQAVAIRLTGKDASKFVVTYDANMRVTTPDGSVNNQHGTFKGQQGSWCGETTTLAGKRVWINTLTVAVSAAAP